MYCFHYIYSLKYLHVSRLIWCQESFVRGIQDRLLSWPSWQLGLAHVIVGTMIRVHQVFHVFMLRKYLRNPDHLIGLEPIPVQQDQTLECRLLRILESQELEKLMRQKYSNFSLCVSFVDSLTFLLLFRQKRQNSRSNSF